MLKYYFPSITPITLALFCSPLASVYEHLMRTSQLLNSYVFSLSAIQGDEAICLNDSPCELCVVRVKWR